MAKKIFTTTFFLISFAFLLMVIYFLFFYDFGLSGNLGGNPAKEAAGGNQSGAALIELDDKKTAQNQGGDAGQAKPDKVELDVERLSASFAERFGSYSNHSNFRNMTDLQIFMTERMRIWTSNYIAKLKEDSAADTEYYGITTKAVAQKIVEPDDGGGRATVVVNTRRREALNTTENTTKVFNQDLTLKLVKIGGEWKVDEASWGI